LICIGLAIACRFVEQAQRVLACAVPSNQECGSRDKVFMEKKERRRKNL